MIQVEYLPCGEGWQKLRRMRLHNSYLLTLLVLLARRSSSLGYPKLWISTIKANVLRHLGMLKSSRKYSQISQHLEEFQDRYSSHKKMTTIFSEISILCHNHCSHLLGTLRRLSPLLHIGTTISLPITSAGSVKSRETQSPISFSARSLFELRTNIHHLYR